MDNNFDPYREWLGLEGVGQDPDHYQVLGLTRFETDATTIHLAAEKAMSRVRGFRPGAQARHWANLLDKLKEVKDCLADAGKKAAYDERLRAALSAPAAAASPATTAGNLAGGSMPSSAMGSMFPPGMGGSSPLAPVSAAPAPVTPVPTQSVTNSPGYPQPANPQAAYPQAAYQQPAGNYYQQPVAPPQNLPDPMAPLGSPITMPVASMPAATMPSAYAMPQSPYGQPAMAQPMMAQPIGGQPMMAMAVPMVSPPAAPPAMPEMPLELSQPMPTPLAASSLAAAPLAASMAVAAPALEASPSFDLPGPTISPVGGHSGNQPSHSPGVSLSTAKSTGSDKKKGNNQSEVSKIALIVAGVALLANVVWTVILLMQSNGLKKNNEEQMAKFQQAQDNLRGDLEKFAVDRTRHEREKAALERDKVGLNKLVEQYRDRLAKMDAAPKTPPKTEPPKPEVVKVDPPKPEPTKPEPPKDPPPTKEELAALTSSLVAMREAMIKRDLPAAEAELAKAKLAAKLPEHKMTVERAARLLANLQAFWKGVGDGLGMLKQGDELMVGSTSIVVEDSAANSLNVKIGDTKKKYDLKTLTYPIAQAIADKGLDPASAAGLSAKGAFATVDPRGGVEDAKGLFEQAMAAGGVADEIKDLELLRDIKFEFAAADPGDNPFVPPTTPTTPTDPPASSGDAAQLLAALKSAKEAMAKRDFTQAGSELGKAKVAAKTPEQKAMVDRLSLLQQHLQVFWKGVGNGLSKLEAAEVLRINGGDFSVVETDGAKIHIVVKYLGKNIRYEHADIPAKLALYLLERGLNAADASTRVARGAFLAIDPKGSIDEARSVWEEASLAGGDVKDLLAWLGDKY